MANIATVFVRVESAPDAPLWTADDFFRYLLHPHLGTYYVPLWHRVGDGVFDLQYGAKWTGGFAIDQIWAVHGDRLRSVWVRYYDDGGDFDVIGHRTAAMADESEFRVCDYWYDGIRLVWRSGWEPDPAQFPKWSATPSGWWYATGERRRRAANERNTLADIERPTPTTNAWFWGTDVQGWHEHLRLFGLPQDVLDGAAALALRLQRIELRWRGRTVEVVERTDDDPDDDAKSWIRLSLDDWDTCADPQYLNHFGMP
ncbi:hypothetical protein ACIHDR_45515 [Nocardia sp. NPDC052278]|uniref:hypothetical protein n=1 Tax=unclassified Nocardia TaxID=2637762 RepID=UPI0036977083